MENRNNIYNKIGKWMQISGALSILQWLFMILAVIFILLYTYSWSEYYDDYYGVFAYYPNDNYLIVFFVFLGLELLLGLFTLVLNIIWMSNLKKTPSAQISQNFETATSLLIIGLIFQVILLELPSAICYIIGWNKLKQGLIETEQSYPGSPAEKAEKSVAIIIFGQIASILYIGLPIYYIGMIVFGNNFKNLGTQKADPSLYAETTFSQPASNQTIGQNYHDYSQPAQTMQFSGVSPQYSTPNPAQPIQPPQPPQPPQPIQPIQAMSNQQFQNPTSQTKTLNQRILAPERVPLALISPTSILGNLGKVMKKVAIWNLIFLIMRFFLYLFGGLAIEAMWDEWGTGIFTFFMVLGALALIGFTLTFTIYMYEQAKLISLFQELYQQSKNPLIRKYIAFHLVSLTGLNANIFLVSFISRLVAFYNLKSWSEQMAIRFNNYAATEIQSSFNFLFWAHILQGFPLLGIILPIAYFKTASSLEKAELSGGFQMDPTRFFGPQKICPICGRIHFP